MVPGTSHLLTVNFETFLVVVRIIIKSIMEGRVQMKAFWRVTMMGLLTLISVFVLFPKQGLAVDYSITDVQIEAFLLEDGSVNVHERHTYSFEDEFNGITREAIPKKGTKISDFTATENGKELKVVKEDSLYKIHRKGDAEQITVDLGYSINHGVEVYSDVAEFHWPFFDDRNDSTYENLVITIHPPKETNDAIGFGYDEAFETQTIHSNGTVVFNLGEVPSGENGDIRVAYEASLFPAASIAANKPMKTEILSAHQELLDEAAAKAKAKENLSTIAMITIPVLIVLLIALMFIGTIRKRIRKAAVEREIAEGFFVPEQVMSLPATIVYTNGLSVTTPETMAAALMDLVRKGYVIKVSDTQFKIDHIPPTALEHEEILSSFLFYQVGSNGEFSFDDLATYTAKESNHQVYHEKEQKWLQAVTAEVKNQDLYEKNTRYRWWFAVVGILLIPLFVLFAVYGLFGWFVATIILSFTAIFYSIFYHPKTWKGWKVSLEWDALKQRFTGLTPNEWQGLSIDDQMRAYIYGIGIKNRGIIEKNEELVKSFQSPLHNQVHMAGSHGATDVAAFTYFGPIATSSFLTANQTSQSSISNSSSSSIGGGGGTGGGGGGSGAF